MQRSGIREIAPLLPIQPRIPLRAMPGYGHRVSQTSSNKIRPGQEKLSTASSWSLIHPSTGSGRTALKISPCANPVRAEPVEVRTGAYDLFFVIDSPFDRLRANGFEDFAVLKPRSC
jgi:hypothetical protein